MPLKPALQLKPALKLQLTPQLAQSIRLLGLSQDELVTALQSLIDANPLLERGLDEDTESTLAAASTTLEDEDEPAWEWDDPAGDQAIDLARSSLPAVYPEQAELKVSAPRSLKQHLREQVVSPAFSPREQELAELLIDALEDNGYLAADLLLIQQALPPGRTASPVELDAVRRKLQQCDPSGIASLNLRDCLSAQLAEWREHPAYPVAQALLGLNAAELTRPAAILARRLAVAEPAVHTALSLLRSLHPYPGARFASAPTHYLQPDLHLRRQAGGWQVELAPNAQPALRLDYHYYRALRPQLQGMETAWLDGRLAEARWLLKSLGQRAATLLRVGKAIVARQQAFFEYGPAAMQPLLLRDIAEELELHVSTVSRAVRHKYLQSPRGLWPLKYFFSPRLGPAPVSPGAVSARAIEARLQQLIAAENPAAPLSDQAITHRLQSLGLAVSRRTIAKYRLRLRIPDSASRQRHA